MNEYSLSVHNSGRVKSKLQGECYHCVKKGYREIYCFLKKKGVPNKRIYGGINSGKFNRSCHNCGKIFHKKEQFWEIAKHLDIRPRNWKGNAESSNVATNHHTDQSHMELMLMKIPSKTLPESDKLLLETNIMVADNVATCYKTHTRQVFST